MKKQAAAEDAKEIFDTIKSPKKLATTRDSKKGDTIKKTQEATSTKEIEDSKDGLKKKKTKKESKDPNALKRPFVVNNILQIIAAKGCVREPRCKGTRDWAEVRKIVEEAYT